MAADASVINSITTVELLVQQAGEHKELIV